MLRADPSDPSEPSDLSSFFAVSRRDCLDGLASAPLALVALFAFTKPFIPGMGTLFGALPMYPMAEACMMDTKYACIALN